MELSSQPSHRTSGFVIGGAALAAILVFANSLANGFAFDDVWIIQNRDLVHGLGNLPQLLTADYWSDRLGSGLYRPFTLLTFAFDWWLWGGAPFGFHLLNVLLHAAVTAGLMALLLHFFPRWAALLGGVVFAVHPVHTEAVANVVGRAELLSAVAVVPACLIYVGAVRRGQRIGACRVAAIAALYAVALLSKESGVVLPALLLILDLPGLARGDIRRLGIYARSRAPLIGVLSTVLVAYLAARWLVLGSPLESVPDWVFAPDASLSTRFFTMARVWPRYLQLLFFPIELSADYSPAVILPVGGLTFMGALGIALLASLAFLAVATFRRRPGVAVAVAWAAIALLPVSNLLVVTEIALAERTLYLPSVAVSILAAVAILAVRAPLRVWLSAGVAFWIAIASFITVTRNPVWRSTDSVFEDLLKLHPESARVLWWLGQRRLHLGDWEGAKQWFYRSLEVWPYQAQYLGEFAVDLKEHGEMAEAERMAERAVALMPRHADNHILLCVIRLQRDDPTGALEAADRASEAVGERELLYWLRADAYERLGEFADAASAAETALRLRGSETAWQNWLRLARLRVASGDTAAALAALETAEELPDTDKAVLDSLRARLGGEAR